MGKKIKENMTRRDFMKKVGKAAAAVSVLDAVVLIAAVAGADAGAIATARAVSP